MGVTGAGINRLGYDYTNDRLVSLQDTNFSDVTTISFITDLLPLSCVTTDITSTTIDPAYLPQTNTGHAFSIAYHTVDDLFYTFTQQQDGKDGYSSVDPSTADSTFINGYITADSQNPPLETIVTEAFSVGFQFILSIAPPESATITACGGQMIENLDEEEIIDITCGSIIVTVINGDIDLVVVSTEGDSAEVSLDTADEFFFDDDTFTLESTVGTAEVTIVAEDETTTEITLEEDNSITVDPETTIIIADPDNPTDVVIVVDGEEETIPPGESAASSPEQAIQNLIDVAISMNVHQGTENSLISNLDSAIDKLTDTNPNNDSAACGQLGSFENKVDAQDSKKLTTEQAETLRELVSDIKSAIDCI